MFSNFNQTTRSKSQTANNFRNTNSSVEKIIPSQRRDKLKNLLIVKFRKKYGLNDTEQVLEDEISNFLKNEKLTDKDLKNFDNHLNQIISETRTSQNLRNNLNNNVHNNNSDDDEKKVKLPDINNDNASVVSDRSKMSGISKLSKFSDMNDVKRAIKKATYKDFKEEVDKYNEGKLVTPVELQGDNWGAINKYNHKMFEQEKKESKMKDKEVKRRLRDDLDIQMREKMLKNHAELKMNREFDYAFLQHVENLNNLEKEKELGIKKKILMTKTCRDNQLKDEIKKRKIETKENKKYEREVGINTN